MMGNYSIKPDSTTRYIIFDEFSKFGSSLYAKNLRKKGRKKTLFSTYLLKIHFYITKHIEIR